MAGKNLNDERIRQAAIDLLEKDRAFNDDIFTPLGAIGMGPTSGPEGSGDHEPRLPKNPSGLGSIALEVPSSCS